MATLAESVYKTVVYFDLFDFAPTLLDLEKWLLRHDESAPTLSAIHTLLSRDSRIVEVDGTFVLRGRESLAQLRRLKYDWTDEKWKHAKKFLRLIAMMPGVEAVWLANSMAWGNVRDASDTDIVVVAQPNRIWTARFFTTAAMKLLRQRPEEQSPEKALCLSLYLTDDHLNLEQFRLGVGDIHYSFWAYQFYPVFDNGQFKTYRSANSWLKKEFASLRWSMTHPRRAIRLSAIERICKKMLNIIPLERTLKFVQSKIMPERLRAMANRDKRVIMNDSILKLHTNDTRMELQKRWEQRIAASS